MGFQVQKQRSSLRYVAWVPILLGAVSVLTASIWYYYASLALIDTQIMAALITIPLPAAFGTYLPVLLAASLAFVIVQAVLVWALYAWRSLQQHRADQDPSGSALSAPRQLLLQRRRAMSIASGVLTGLQYLVTLWFVFMMALSMLWFGGGLVASKATSDGATTMSVVDETMPRLIQNAMGIDPRKQGYLVHVGDRDVNIGTSTCSLFCFTLARAMMADTIDCTCNEQLASQLMPPGNVTADITDSYTCSAAPVMCSINAQAFKLYKQHMKPAVIAVVVTVLCLLGLLSLVSGTHARIKNELRSGGSLSRTSSADADMRISTSGSDTDELGKGDAKVAV